MSGKTKKNVFTCPGAAPVRHRCGAGADRVRGTGAERVRNGCGTGVGRVRNASGQRNAGGTPADLRRGVLWQSPCSPRTAQATYVGRFFRNGLVASLAKCYIMVLLNGPQDGRPGIFRFGCTPISQLNEPETAICGVLRITQTCNADRTRRLPRVEWHARQNHLAALGITTSLRVLPGRAQRAKRGK